MIARFLFVSLVIVSLPGLTNAEVERQNSREVAILLPLTGTFADWGHGILKGVNVALRDFSSIHGNVQDDACEGAKATNAAHLLISKGVRIFFVSCVASVKAIAPIIEKADGVVFVLGGIDNETLRLHSNVIDLATEVGTEAKYLAAYMASQPEVRKVGIIHGTNLFGEELGSELAKSLESRGRTVASHEKMDISSTDCRAIALRTIARHPDATFVHGSESSSGQCVKALRQSGFVGVIFAPYTTESDSFLQAAGPASEGIRYTFNSGSVLKNSTTLEWEKKFISEFHNSPISHALIAYDGIRLLNDSLVGCGSIGASCILKYFKSLGEVDGISGKVVFQSNGGALRPFGIKEIRQGKFEWVVDEVRLGSK
jgi:branched-chain amino acid transport system substrate-binding protein